MSSIWRNRICRRLFRDIEAAKGGMGDRITYTVPPCRKRLPRDLGRSGYTNTRRVYMVSFYGDSVRLEAIESDENVSSDPYLKPCHTDVEDSNVKSMSRSNSNQSEVCASLNQGSDRQNNHSILYPGQLPICAVSRTSPLSQLNNSSIPKPPSSKQPIQTSPSLSKTHPSSPSP